MPPPQASGLPLLERVTTSPLANVLDVLVPPPPVPVTYVPKIPISNSFPLKYETGGGGGATTSFDGGGPAKQTITCDPRTPMAKANLFIRATFLIALSVSHTVFDTWFGQRGLDYFCGNSSHMSSV